MNVHPVLSEIVAGALRAIEEEVEDLLGRLGRGAALRDTGGFSASLFDRFGRALTGRSLVGTPRPVLEAFGAERIRPDDVFLHNDPYLASAGFGPPAELSLTLPLFAEKKLIAFLQVCGRHDDLGGVRPGGGFARAEESYHEGLLIPLLRIARRGELAQDIRSLLVRNSRTAEHLGDDLEAQLGALRLGAGRFRDLVMRYGPDIITACFADLLRECELLFRDDILPRLPEGRWGAEASVETDGFSGPHLLRLAFQREGDRAVIDLEGTGPQARGPINCPLEGEGRTFLIRLLAPLLLRLPPDDERREDVLLNDGAGRAFEVRLPERGTLVTPRFPAPTGLRHLTLSKLIAAFADALSQAAGGKAPAGFDGLRDWTLSGTDPADGSGFRFREALGAGLGAGPEADGTSAVSPFGGAGGMPVEIAEARYPIRVESAGLAPDSGGAGRRRGGLGTFREYRILVEAEASSAAGAADSGPAGNAGGGVGGGYRIRLMRAGRASQEMPAVASAVPVAAGQVLRVETPGGGGWGVPAERAPEEVRLDVLRGYVSPQAAREVYRVALKGGADRGVDHERTAALRRGAGGGGRAARKTRKTGRKPPS